MFKYEVAHKCTCYQTTLGQRSMIDFAVILSDLQLGVLDKLVNWQTARWLWKVEQGSVQSSQVEVFRHPEGA